MAIDVVMPQMGESVVEGTVAKWLVKEGERVEEGQALLEISTDKIDTELPSPASGVIAQILAREGETLRVGARLAVLEEGAGVEKKPSKPALQQAQEKKEGTAKPSAQSAPEVGEAQTRSAAQVDTDEDARAVEWKVPERAPVTAADERTELLSAVDESMRERGEPTQPSQPSAAGEERRRLSPVVMKMAAEYNIDVTQIPGTGIGGRVTKRDLLNYLESRESSRPQMPPKAAAAADGAVEPEPPRQAPLTAGRPLPAGAPSTPSVYTPPEYHAREGDIVEQFSRRRKIIAEHMVYSKTHSPHVGIVALADITRLARFRDTHKEAFSAREGFSLTLLPMVAMATIRALKEFPRMNASVVGDSLIIRKEINLGIAVDSEEGLVVPVIKSADQKSLLGIAREIETMRRKTVERRLTADDLAGGSFTISNPGREGNLFGFAIINQPQVGILRMGEVRKEPKVIEVDGAEAIAIRTVMYLTCSYDHRVVDGVLGNRFLYRVARILEAADFDL
jgi:pyruvate/2-oxoglutarate dehydrogenase complex dihydrolipoamide acyltransferase (E2) component